MPQMDYTTFFFYIEYSVTALIVLNIFLFTMHKVAIFAEIKLLFSRKSVSKFHAFRCANVYFTDNVCKTNAV